MIILGLNGFLHDSAACLIQDGKLIAFAEEERFSRKKHTFTFPSQTIKYCLSEADISMSEVDKIAFFWNPYKEIAHKFLPFIKELPHTLKLFTPNSAINPFMRRILGKLRVYRDLKKEFGLTGSYLTDLFHKQEKRKFYYVDHHLAHAASAFFVSPFEEAAILVADGYGEVASTVLAYGKGNKITPLAKINFPHSLGQLYGSITEYLGYRICNCEGKIMALSSFGEPIYEPVFDRLIQLHEDGSYHFDLSYLEYHRYGLLKMMSDKFTSLTSPPRKAGDVILQSHRDLAASMQKALEKTLFFILNKLHQQTGSKNLCLAGGVILNSVANGKIEEQTPFENLYLQPAAHDAGTALGAAYYLYHQKYDQPRSMFMEHAYWGPEFSDPEIEKAIQKKNALQYRKSNNITQEAAKIITEGKVLGWFQGRMEVGPRALGNRSILADPRNPQMKEFLNDKVKHREPYRPFAPAVLEEKVAEYFNPGKPEPFMLRVYPIRPEKRALIPAAAHVDGTGRLQTVSIKTNPLFWHLINEFYKLTGVPVVLNTSFNDAGEPIVCTPDDALNCFLNTQIDALAIGSFLVFKSNVIL